MKLYVFPPSPNSRKVTMANALTGANEVEQIVDLQTGEQKSDAILAGACFCASVRRQSFIRCTLMEPGFSRNTCFLSLLRK